MNIDDSVSESEALVQHRKRIESIRFKETDRPLRVLQSAFPEYPDSARRSGIEGLVEIELTINTEGAIENIRVLQSPDDSLSNACVEAVKQWRFEPITKNGQPISTKVIQRFPFKLQY